MRTQRDSEFTIGTTTDPDLSGGADQATVLSVAKALLITELLMRADGPLTAREVADQLALNRTTAHRLLGALLHRGWIDKVPGTAAYRLSLRFLALTRLANEARDWIGELRPTLERLSELSRETVHVGVLDGFDVVHVDKVDSPEQIGVSSKIGTRAVPHVTGLGKAILASAPAAFVEDYLAYARGLPPPLTITDPVPFRADLRLTRERGYSIDNEEASLGVRCLGVAVLGAGGEPVCAISLTGPSPRFTMNRLAECVPELLATARDLSHRFGWEAAVRGQRSEARGQ